MQHFNAVLLSLALIILVGIFLDKFDFFFEFLKNSDKNFSSKRSELKTARCPTLISKPRVYNSNFITLLKSRSTAVCRL
jgi:hypothetical protein